MYKNKHPKKNTSKKHTKAIWLSDLHLDKASNITLSKLLHRIENTPSDIVIITGDISTSPHLCNHLSSIAKSAKPRNVYFVTGNHDFYLSSLDEVDTELKSLCSKVSNLHYMTGDGVTRLNPNTCLIGLPSFADARAGLALRTKIQSPDNHAIRDFSELAHIKFLCEMQKLGRKSASVIRQVLPLALTQYEHVIIMTHVPPFAKSVKYNGKECAPSHLPHYVNLSVGLVIGSIAKAFLGSKVTVLSGHSHNGNHSKISANVSARVAHARPGIPAFKTLDL